MKNFDKTRQELAEAGWRREDKQGMELWRPPEGKQPRDLVSYKRARERLKKDAGTLASQEDVK